jgi:hypothetical protein
MKWRTRRLLMTPFGLCLFGCLCVATMEAQGPPPAAAQGTPSGSGTQQAQSPPARAQVKTGAKPKKPKKKQGDTLHESQTAESTKKDMTTEEAKAILDSSRSTTQIDETRGTTTAPNQIGNSSRDSLPTSGGAPPARQGELRATAPPVELPRMNDGPVGHPFVISVAIVLAVGAVGVLLFLLIQIRSGVRALSHDVDDVRKRMEQFGIVQRDTPYTTAQHVEAIPIFHLLPKHLPKIWDAVSEIRARLAKAGGGPLSPVPPPVAPVSPRQPTTGWPHEQGAPVTTTPPTEALRALAAECLRSPMTQTQLRARLQAGWNAKGHGDGGERPDGFIVNTGGEYWLVPNTKSWKSFRGGGYFIPHGHDNPQSLITNVTVVPQVYPRGGGYEVVEGGEGHVELSIG